MTNSTIAATTTIEQLLPISAKKFDVRLSSADGSLLVYREDTGACIIDVKLSDQQIAEIQSAQ